MNYTCSSVKSCKNSCEKSYGVFSNIYLAAHNRGGLISIKNGGSLGLPSVSSASKREAPLFDATLSACVCVRARARERTVQLHFPCEGNIISLLLAIRGTFFMRFSSARLSPLPPSPTRRNCVACAASAYFECPVREYQKLLIHSMPLRVCTACTRARAHRWSLCVLSQASDSQPRCF